MIYLWATLAALAAGPLLVRMVGERRGTIPFLDGFVVLAVPGLIFVHFVPAAVEQFEWATLIALGLGFMAPVLLERLSHDHHGRTDRLALALGVTGLALHAAIDGAALPGLDGTRGLAFGTAIVLHRIPVGLAVWWLASSRLGRAQAVASIGLLMGVTALGYLGGSGFAAFAGSGGVELYQAAVGGSLVHVVFHRSHRSGTPQLTPLLKRIEGAGAIVALLVLVAVVVAEGVAPGGSGSDLAASHAHGGPGFLRRLFVLSAESAPALLAAYLFAGVLHAFLPATSIRWMSRGGPLSSAGRGMVVGLPLPICSCGVVPLYRTLVQRGAPPAAAMAFLVATPELGLDAVFLSIPLLGPQMAGLRLLAAAAAALLVGWWVGGRLKARAVLPVAASGADGAESSVASRLRLALRTGLGEVVDHTAPWIIVGLGIAALAAPLLESGWLASLPPAVDVLIFALLGFPTYVCASSATPLVATLIATGLSPGAAIAFLITGPATNATTLGVIGSVHDRRIALRFAAVLVGFAVVAGLLVNGLVGRLPVPSLAELVDEVPGALQQLSLLALGLLFVSSIFRNGIRSFVAQLSEGLGAGAHGHEHDHGHHDHHGHDHARAHGHGHGHDHRHDHGHDDGHGHGHDDGHDHDPAHDHRPTQPHGSVAGPPLQQPLEPGRSSDPSSIP